MNDFYFLTVQITKSQTTTIIVATSPFHTTTTTVTPTIGQSVELQCSGDGVGKRWYTTGSVVEATQNEISTSSGNTRILAFSSFTPSHAGTYTCLVSSVGDTQTKTTYPVVLGESLCDNRTIICCKLVSLVLICVCTCLCIRM